MSRPSNRSQFTQQHLGSSLTATGAPITPPLCRRRVGGFMATTGPSASDTGGPASVGASAVSSHCSTFVSSCSPDAPAPSQGQV